MGRGLDTPRDRPRRVGRVWQRLVVAATHRKTWRETWSCGCAVGHASPCWRPAPPVPAGEPHADVHRQPWRGAAAAGPGLFFLGAQPAGRSHQGAVQPCASSQSGLGAHVGRLAATRLDGGSPLNRRHSASCPPSLTCPTLLPGFCLPQQRQVGDVVLLEASLENATRAPMLLESITFLPTPAYTAQCVCGGGGGAEAGPLGWGPGRGTGV